MATVSKEELVRLQKVLKTDAAIGKQVGVSRQAIHQARVKYGIKAVDKNKERNQKIISLYKKGKTGIAIAKEIGISVSRAYAVIQRYS